MRYHRGVPISRDVLERAAAGDRRAVVDVLAYYYPPIHRLSVGLTGSTLAATRSVRRVLVRAMDAVGTLPDPQAANHWFMRQAVQQLRGRRVRRPAVVDDELARAGPNDPAYHAFVRALRLLPVQQQEALLLRLGERVDLRTHAIATDCSTTAATTHYDAGLAALRQVGGPGTDSMLAVLLQAYYLLTPVDRVVLPAVGDGVRRYVWPRRLRRIIAMVLGLVTLTGIGWFYFRVWPMLDF